MHAFTNWMHVSKSPRSAQLGWTHGRPHMEKQCEKVCIIAVWCQRSRCPARLLAWTQQRSASSRAGSAVTEASRYSVVTLALVVRAQVSHDFEAQGNKWFTAVSPRKPSLIKHTSCRAGTESGSEPVVLRNCWFTLLCRLQSLLQPLYSGDGGWGLDQRFPNYLTCHLSK